MSTDIKFMRHAIALAQRALGLTSPNPLVGCVIVKRGRTIAEGWHKVCGADHAEVDALKKAGLRARGSDMYVTLEPCAHWGKTPPCVEAVIAAGIRKVVVAMKDPNPLINGKSIRKLRAHGIEVVTGVCEVEARGMNLAFIKYISTKMPYVVAKTAQTMDGVVGTRSGKVRWITSAATRNLSTARRDEFDAIVAGVETVLADDPGLNAPGKAIAKVVVDSCLRMPLTARLLKGAQPGRVIIATTAQASPQKVAAFRKQGVCVMVCAAKAGRVDLKALFKELAKNGLIRILVEGGPTLINAAMAQRLVDRMHIYIAPKVMGHGPDIIKGADVARLFNEDKLDVASVQRTGRDIFIEADYVHRDH